MNNKFVLAIHGGAGTILKSQMTKEKEIQYKNVLQQSLDVGYKVLKSGGTSVAAVEAAVIVLEDSDLFNAGKGAVFSSEGKHELEASIMRGKDLQAGAIGGAVSLKNPISVSRKIMEESDYVYLVGNGATQFAKEKGFEEVPNNYFYSEHRHQQWQSVKNSNDMKLDHSHATDKKFGTVGAVALDVYGNLAAATSTGGLVNKKYGRLGDSSVIGAGVYANDQTCAISCTGYGEFFLRGVVAYDISCLMEYKGMSLNEAAKKVIMEKQPSIGGEGGVIGVDTDGNSCMIFNSEGMYRGKIDDKKSESIGFYEDVF